ncbi:MAG: inosine monophosphate cyclohydrolase [Firmicutes bacterium]|nr:inosine monophosphate cyclohydrolase [Bacillota bacterium]
MPNRWDVKTYFQGNSYPGRGIIMGLDPGGKYGLVAYFLMGRSVNSRNRIFTQCGEGIKTQAYDPALVEDPSLIIYHPVRVWGSNTIVTNGDQTDTIFAYLQRGESFAAALRTRTYEPDAPNYTPRISGLATLKEGKFSYRLSIIKKCPGEGRAVRRFFYEYEDPLPGEGHLIHTYKGDGNPLPSFGGEPVPLALGDAGAAFGQELWASLHRENKVALFVRYLHLATGKYQSVIYNKLSDLGEQGRDGN